MCQGALNNFDAQTKNNIKSNGLDLQCEVDFYVEANSQTK